ncbi:hypothetical protein [Methanolapillus millepedarum]|uniref:Transglutaminase-like domain-containing protein n=1 Tax=Methanolapillus millepedarum TaxID=3028296 RepID=A0AA96VB75_9EURY|nr:hypothetical protein MsAc7_04600 [Methanosarcinaceae archaeon Ac7]
MSYTIKFLLAVCLGIVLLFIGVVFLSAFFYALDSTTYETNDENGYSESNPVPYSSSNYSNTSNSTANRTESINISLTNKSAVNSSNASVFSSNYHTKTYKWKYDGSEWTYTISIPDDAYSYYTNKPHNRGDYNQYALSDYDRKILGQLVESFREQGTQNNYTDDEVVLNIISFIQAMPYTSDSVTTGYDEYPRYPLETLVDGGGDCEDSAILAAALLSEMGYGTVLLAFPGHMALGVKGSENLTGTYYEYRGSRYYYVETTASGHRIGQIPSDVQSSSAHIYPMVQVPRMTAEVTSTFLQADSRYAYYEIYCDMTNLGPGTAKNVSVYIYAETPPFDSTKVWSQQDVYIGNFSEDGTGYAKATLRVPRGEQARFGCTIHGDNFQKRDYYFKSFYQS